MTTCPLLLVTERAMFVPMAYRRGHWYFYGTDTHMHLGHGRHVDSPVTTDVERAQWDGCGNDPDEPKGINIPFDVFDDLVAQYVDRHPERIEEARRRQQERAAQLTELERKLDSGEINDEIFSRLELEICDTV